ncbi:MAG: hypothetical protein LUB59_03300 [Candidatus Gastranaerophilales bacterium]|nr:hypothetical protein [Candidatus Gastranaerophilales bacterium]
MNSKYEETLDKNFDRALELCSNSYSYGDLIGFLKSGNIAEKQYAALEISELRTQEDAEIFLSNLINCDGKIREATAQKFLEFVKNKIYCGYFSKFPVILAKSTIDINANISRMVIDGLYYLKGNEEFADKYVKIILRFIDEAFQGLDKIVYKDKKYTINKQIFKLYWCLEGLNNFCDYVCADKLRVILGRAIDLSEYTVREKAAQLIMKNSSNQKFKYLVDRVTADENYYVRLCISQ